MFDIRLNECFKYSLIIVSSPEDLLFFNRLNKFSEDYCLICENQGGFRKGYSTTDNLFVIYMLIYIMKNKKKKLYCAFIDFAKAKQLIIVIGLKLLASSLSPLFLYNGIIFPDNQSSGIQPLSNIILNSVT
jgi:hypothetical protein